MILLRTVNKDVSRYNAIDLSDDIQEDFGWKLVHAEVFRQPQHPMLLSIVNGSGSQFGAMLVVAIFFALLGFLSPSNRGGLSTVMIVCWTLFGCESPLLQCLSPDVVAEKSVLIRHRGICLDTPICITWRSSMEAKYPLDSNSLPYHIIRYSQLTKLLPTGRRIIRSCTVRYSHFHRCIVVLDFSTAHGSGKCIWNEERAASTSCQSQSDS